jgi:hypothetical protein
LTEPIVFSNQVICKNLEKEHNEKLTNKYTYELPTGTPAAEEYATKAKRHPNRTFTPFQSSQRSCKKEIVIKRATRILNFTSRRINYRTL